jgi:predicted dinucleotide-binding enzyme
MNIAVLGSGMVGRTLAAAFAHAGHEVAMGTRDVGQLLERDAGGQPFSAWFEEHERVTPLPFAEAAGVGELVVNATAGAVSLEALHAAGATALDGKILLDVANPLDFSGGMPPTLTVANTDSLGEQIQRAFPEARVVKALNTVTAALMVQPELLGHAQHDLFVCGNDAGAKAEIVALLREEFGWRTVHDLGDISAARGTEMYLILWVRLMGVHGGPNFNVRVVT